MEPPNQIIDLEVLNDMFAVEGWTWNVEPWPANGPQGFTVSLSRGQVSVSINRVGELNCNWDVTRDRIPARVITAAYCAHLGLPPPWRTVKRLVDELEDLASVGEYEDEYLVYRGSAIAFETAVEIAKGNQ